MCISRSRVYVTADDTLVNTEGAAVLLLDNKTIKTINI